MLRTLHIRNLAVIQELELEFGPGMSVFTGETGAGKSILVDALGLVLGDRADSNVIRSGADNAEVSALFDISGFDGVAGILTSQALESADGELLLRRVISRDGRSRAYMNGSAVAAQTLREVGDFLVEIHGQHAHQSLLKREEQRRVLDQFGDHSELLGAVRRACSDWTEARRQLAELPVSGEDHAAQKELLDYQVQELEEFAPAENELDSLNADHRRLANAGRLLDTVQTLLARLHEDEDSAAGRVGVAVRELRDAARFDENMNAVADLLDSAGIQLGEAVDELRAATDHLDLDPQRLGEVERRLDQYHELARKHRVKPQELITRLQTLKQQCQALADSSSRIDQLNKQQSEALRRYTVDAKRLHEQRRETAERLGKAISLQLRELGMPGGRLKVEVKSAGGDRPMPSGDDQVEFLVTVNPGQPPRPLAKVASGGELSRISLGIQVIDSTERGTPTLIFDEVDAGIGGAVAEIVGRLLHGLSERRQILCVTHLPQVACQGDYHFQVEKSSSRTDTRTQVVELNADRRIEEIARMLGGLKISAKTRDHAREMLNTSGKLKVKS